MSVAAYAGFEATVGIFRGRVLVDDKLHDVRHLLISVCGSVVPESSDSACSKYTAIPVFSAALSTAVVVSTLHLQDMFANLC